MAAPPPPGDAGPAERQALAIPLQILGSRQELAKRGQMRLGAVGCSQTRSDVAGCSRMRVPAEWGPGLVALEALLQGERVCGAGELVAQLGQYPTVRCRPRGRAGAPPPLGTRHKVRPPTIGVWGHGECRRCGGHGGSDFVP